MQEDKTEANVDGLHLRPIVNEIIECATSEQIQTIGQLSDGAKADRLDELNQRSVEHTVVGIVERSVLIRDAVERGDLLVLGAVYDMKSGSVRFMNRDVKQASLEKDVQW